VDGLWQAAKWLTFLPVNGMIFETEPDNGDGESEYQATELAQQDHGFAPGYFPLVRMMKSAV
jgi:hypothetical protein